MECLSIEVQSGERGPQDQLDVLGLCDHTTNHQGCVLGVLVGFRNRPKILDIIL